VATRRWLVLGFGLVLLSVLIWPHASAVPVAGATPGDWNSESFWYEPWGASGVHKGIDIFAPEGADVIASAPGLVVFSGTLPRGGEVLAVLSAGWRIHYYAHLSRRHVEPFDWVSGGEVIGAVGSTGNAQGKPAHLHFSVVSLVPYPWLATAQTQGWKRMFFLDPNRVFRDA